MALANPNGERLFEQRCRAYAPIRHLLADTVRQGAIPVGMKDMFVSRSIYRRTIDPTSDTDQATLLRFLIDIVLHETDGQVLGDAEQKVRDANRQSGKEGGKPVAYFYPISCWRLRPARIPTSPATQVGEARVA